MSLPQSFRLRFKDQSLEGERFAPEHVPAVLGLEHICFPAPWSEGLLRQEAEPREHAWNLVVRVDGALKAFFFNWIVLDEVHLLNFAVSPELQGRGLGGFLLDWLLEQARTAGFANISLEVRASNSPAIGLYQSRGFTRLYVRRNYYTDNGEDALILLRALKPKEDVDALADP